jgi:hypothetical protein
LLCTCCLALRVYFGSDSLIPSGRQQLLQCLDTLGSLWTRACEYTHACAHMETHCPRIVHGSAGSS